MIKLAPGPPVADPKVSEVLPLLYLHGLSTGDFVPALEQFLGSTAGLSPATISRLTATWTEDHKAFQARDLSECDFVYVWADGVHLKVRLEEAKEDRVHNNQHGVGEAEWAAVVTGQSWTPALSCWL